MLPTMDYWILEGTELKKTNSLEWCQWFEQASESGERFIFNNETETKSGVPVVVSTIFLGLAHGANAKGEPLVFETALIRENCEGTQVEVFARAPSYEVAKQQHQQALDAVSGKECPHLTGSK